MPASLNAIPRRFFFSFRLAKEGWQKVSESLGGNRLAL